MNIYIKVYKQNYWNNEKKLWNFCKPWTAPEKELKQTFESFNSALVKIQQVKYWQEKSIKGSYEIVNFFKKQMMKKRKEIN